MKHDHALLLVILVLSLAQISLSSKLSDGMIRYSNIGYYSCTRSLLHQLDKRIPHWVLIVAGTVLATWIYLLFYHYGTDMVSKVNPFQCTK
jgi:hypothetical protein